MIYRIGSVLATVLALTTWTYYYPKEQMTNQTKVSILSLTERQSQRHVEQWPVALKEQQKVTEKMKKEPKQEPETYIMCQNQTDELVFTSQVVSLSGPLPLETVFILLLIDKCGADLVAAVYEVTLQFPIGSVLELMLGLTSVYAIHRLKSEKEKMARAICELQRELQLKRVYEDATATLLEMKTKMESWKDQLTQSLENVEDGRAENRQQLQSVEMEIAKKVDPEKLLKVKENILREQWKLDQTKKDTEKQILNIEKLMEQLSFVKEHNEAE